MENPKKSSEKSCKEDQIPNQIAVPIFTCEICYEPAMSNNKFKNKERCIHPFCEDCMAKYIQVKVECYREAKVECPGLNCKEILDPISCRPIIPPKAFDKWCDNLCEFLLLGRDKCYCPYQDCSELILNECGTGGVVKKTKCPKCRKKFCFRCKLQWYGSHRCGESGGRRRLVGRDRNDVLFEELVKRKKWTCCPACGHCVELKDGCPIVKCRCNTTFCYTCGKKHGHYEWCESDRTPWLVRIVVFILVLFGSCGIPVILWHFYTR